MVLASPYTDKVLKEKTDAWHHGVSPPWCQQQLESLTDTLRSLAGTRLGAASILANLHHQWIVPLMETELRIYEMSYAANPTALARSRLLHDPFPREYAATRARRAISLRSVPHSHDDLWSFIMLPDAPVVSEPPFPSQSFVSRWCGLNSCHQQRVTVDAARSEPPTPRALAAARAAQRREQEWAARAKERRIRRRERWEQQSEECRLREQQGLPPPPGRYR
jgi:hypothetical protein